MTDRGRGAATATGPGVSVRKLGNGVTVVAEPMVGVRSVAIGIWVPAGSRYERPQHQGISHFVEHLMFKGTTKRSAREIAEVMDAVGGQLNAYTSKEHTCYHARVLDNHLDLAVDVLSDMVLRSLYREEDIDRERSVILEEIGSYQDTPDELVHDLFAQALYGEHPLGWPVLGSPETVRSIDRQLLRDYLTTAYSPSGSVIAVAGSFDPDEMHALLDRSFAEWSGGRPARDQARPDARLATMLQAKETELVHVCLGGEGLALGDERIYALSIMSNILGGGPSSRLFQQVREERGLAYSVYSYTSAFVDGGMFGVYCGAGPERIGTAIAVIGTELRRLAADGVGEPELYRAKEQFKSNLTMALESTGSRMSRLGRAQLLLGRIQAVDEVLDRIEAVSCEDVRALACRFCDPARLSLAAIGPAIERIDLRSALDGGATA